MPARRRSSPAIVATIVTLVLAAATLPATLGATPRTGPGWSPPRATASRGPLDPPSRVRPTVSPSRVPLPSGRIVKPTPSPTPPPPSGPVLAGCPVLPATNVWNRRVDALPVAASSATMVAAIGSTRTLHPDFSNAGEYGIPYNLVSATTPRSTVTFEYSDESDHVGYPIPASPRIEGGSDRHILMVDTDACRLYELFAAERIGTAWHAGSGATWDLRSNTLRPAGWTSADAAGLPILPGLIRYEEVAAGEIRHAIRFTAPRTCDGYIYPARHEAGSGSCATYPPMGLRVRLKASVDISGYGTQARVILTALKRYGMLLADNGSPWYVTGAPNPGWDDDVLHALHGIEGSDFEVVDTTSLRNP